MPYFRCPLPPPHSAASSMRLGLRPSRCVQFGRMAVSFAACRRCRRCRRCLCLCHRCFTRGLCKHANSALLPGRVVSLSLCGVEPCTCFQILPTCICSSSPLHFPPSLLPLCSTRTRCTLRCTKRLKPRNARAAALAPTYQPHLLTAVRAPGTASRARRRYAPSFACCVSFAPSLLPPAPLLPPQRLSAPIRKQH